jgi:hypothetical protein
VTLDVQQPAIISLLKCRLTQLFTGESHRRREAVTLSRFDRSSARYFRQTGAQSLSGGFAIGCDSVEYCCDAHAIEPTVDQSFIVVL